MTAAIRPIRRVLALAAVLTAAAWTLDLTETAHAHGGRIKLPPPDAKPGTPGPMPGRVPRDPPPIPHPPRVPRGPTPQRPPITPGGGDSVKPGRQPNETPTTPPGTARPPPNAPTTPPPREPGTARPGRATGAERRGRKSADAAPEDTWQMWWELNRWSFFPQRGLDRAGGDAVVTPSGGPGLDLDLREVERTRRALVRRQHIVPYLLEQLDPARRVRDEVRAAALLALGKLSQDDAALELMFRHAERAQSSNLVRESAALAVGLVRRSASEAAAQGVTLDRVRTRLLALVDDGQAPDRTRAFAALAIGLLGDQPFGSAFTKDGRVVARGLWERLQHRSSGRDLPVALLTALGMQPRGGLSAEIREGLQRIVAGRRHGGRTWDAIERSHALTALVRHSEGACAPALLRVLTDRRAPAPVRRAAFLGLGAASERLLPAGRLQAMEAAERGLDQARDNLSRGLGWLAVGRIVGADLRAGTSAALTQSALGEKLLAAARHGPQSERGFAALGTALAARDAQAADAQALTFCASALEVLVRGFEREGNPSVRGAYAVGLGLLGSPAHAAGASLTEVVADRRADAQVRGFAALALAQMGSPSSEARKALRAALWDRSSVELRSQSALALSFLGGRAETTLLIQELRRARSQWVLSQVAAALGQLGDVAAVPAVLELACDDKRSDEARALAIASLGLLGDPTPRPSLLRLTRDANYPARTDALREALSIL